MSKVNTIRVPSTGPEDADVMIVGEAPGENEEDEKTPFVGQAGSFAERYVERAGYPWQKTYRTNLSKYRPYGNKFKYLLDSDELREGLEELSREIERVNPNLIVAFGNWPMYYLTGKMADKGKPGSGITSWRGSVIEGIGDHVPSAEGRKVLVTYHPSYIMRPAGFSKHPVFLLNLKKIPKESQNPEISYPPYESHIDPPNLTELAEDMQKSEWLTVDIETFGTSLACVGFADSVKRGLCITYENPSGWDVAQDLLASDQKKIFQFGTFDINWLWFFYGWETRGFAFDTLIASANLFPEMPKGLDFLTSIYTPYPYYKTERKIWKSSGDMRTLWEYNITDCIVTHWIAMEQMKELEELYGKSGEIVKSI